MKNMFKVSVIVPVYNVERYISRCLESLFVQSLQELEIIVVNDGSTDGSEEIIFSYQKKYPGRMRYLKKENGGLSDARNYGIPYAKGEYIAFLDSDDYVESTMYEEMYYAAQNGVKKVVECDFIWEYERKTVVDTVEAYRSISDYLVHGRVVAWNKIYNRKWLNQMEVVFPKGLLYEDVEFFFSLMPKLSSIDEVGYVKFPFVHYVQRNNSISYRESRRIVELAQVYENAIIYLKQQNLYSTYKEELEYKFIRNSLCGFPVKKIRHVKDRTTRKQLLDFFWNKIDEDVPNWKKNKYLQQGGIVNFYLRHVNKWTYKVLFMI